MNNIWISHTQKKGAQMFTKHILHTKTKNKTDVTEDKKIKLR